MAKKKLTARHQDFIRQYLGGPDGVRGNATKAAQAAGYSRKTAYSQGHRLLKKAEVAAAIKALQEKANAGVTRELRDWQELAIGAQDTVIEIQRGDIEPKIAAVQLMAAREVLDRAFGKPPTKVQLSGQVTLSQALDELDD